MKISKLILLTCIWGSIVSCEDLLDPKLTNEWSSETVWTNPDMAQAVLTQVYADLMVVPDHYDDNFLDAATDNALTRNYGSSVYRASMGAFSRSTNPLGNWDTMYDKIQSINLFMEKGVTDDVIYNRVSKETDQAIKTRLLGEAYFLRAWCSFKLLQTYGGRTDEGEALGYTITNHFIGDKESAKPSLFKRDSYKDCVSQIVSDCEEAARRLPVTYTGDDVVVGKSKIGRACGLAANALKARTLLYAASPAYQDKDVIQINGMGNFTVLNEATYQAGWERAALFANEVLKNAGINYTFTAMAAKDLADAGSDTPADFIFRTYMGLVHGMESRHYPPFYLGNAQTIPSHNLAAAFPAKNGYPITDSRSLYDEQDPYLIARDNRFNMNLYYQGKKFGAYNSNIDVSEGGKDSESFHIYASRSGYYLSKFLSTTQKNMLDPIQTLNSRHFNPLLRKTEVWLNYAEAANEAWGPEGKGDDCKYSAYDVLKIIREKSGGITDATYLSEVASEGKDAFRKLIQNERRIEFAFEDHRFWDLRRCLLPLDTTIEGIQVTKTDNGLSYEIKEIEQRPLDALRYYYLPLPNDELLKNPNLKNNMGWNNN